LRRFKSILKIFREIFAEKNQRKTYRDDILAEVIESVREPVSFCDFIDNKIVFYPELGLLSHCCDHYSAEGMPVICEFRGGKFPMESYLRSRRRYVLLNISKTGLCKGCRFLETGLPSESFTQFKYIMIQYESGRPPCSAYGSLPHDGKGKSGSYDVLPTLKKLLSENLLAEGGQVGWAGGESAEGKYFVSAVKFLTNNKISQFFLSDGVLFSDSIAGALAAGNTRLEVSGTHGTNTIESGDYYDLVWNNIKRYNFDGERDISAKYIIRRNNRGDEELAGFVKKSLWAGLKKIIISADHSEYNPLRKKELSTEYVDTAKRLRAIAEQNGLQVALQVFSQDDALSILPEQIKKCRYMLVTAQLYIYSEGQYSESHSSRKSVTIMDGRYKVSFDLHSVGGYSVLPDMKEIRFDPAEEPITFALLESKVVDVDGGSQNIEVQRSNADVYEDGKYIFRHNDPVLIFDSSGIDFTKVSHISFSGIVN
jgi:hypothetical protein